MNNARTTAEHYRKNEKNDNKERCFCAHAREKNAGEGILMLPLARLRPRFFFSTTSWKRGFCRVVLCPFCRLRQKESKKIIFPKENHSVRKNGLSARKCEHFMNLSIFVRVLRTKTASRALLWEDFFPVTKNIGHICGDGRAVRNRLFSKGVFL